jgi:outer membrane receptor protein involved in Fe transport
VEGVVRSAQAEGPLPGANVAIRRASDSTLVDGATTDSTGHFVVEDLPTGQFTVTASFVGYKPVSRTVTLTTADPTRTLAPFHLAGTAAQMEGATVSAERPFVTTRGSKRVYSFENSQVALAGKSAVDVLRDLPSLRIDEMDGTIQLRGNQSVSIHVNGKPVSMSGKALVQYLKGLSGNNIERVEVNTNPSARHDAEGTAGVINIVLDRKEEKGVSGGVSASAGIGPRLEGSANLGYGRGPWTLYGSYSYSQHEHEFERDLLRRSTDESSRLLLDQFAEQQYGHGGHNFNVEVDYALTPKTTLSLASTGSVRGGDQALRMESRHADPASASVREVDEDRRSVHLDERLSVRHEFADKNHELSADLRYETGIQETQVREERVPVPPRERETEEEDEQNASVKLDYSHPLDGWTLETGYKGSLRRLDQRYEVGPFDAETGDAPEVPDRSDALAFQEQVHAGYGVLQRSIGPIDAEVGLRVEHTRTTIDADDAASDGSRYTGLFPSASLTYEMGRGRRVSLSYSKRVERPNAFQLSAFTASGDPYVQFVGNPNLDPEKIHKGELTVMQRVGPATVTVTPYARRKTNAIEWTTVHRDSLTVRTYDNYDARTSYGAELTSSMQLGKAVKATLSGNVYRRRTEGGDLAGAASRTAFVFMERANVTWSLFSDLRLQVSQMYRSPVTTGVGRIGALTRTSTSLEKTFWDDKATVGLRVEDPFNTSEIGIQKQTSGYSEDMTRDWDGRTVSLSFSYRFGNDPKSKQRRRSSGSGGGLGPMGGG